MRQANGIETMTTEQRQQSLENARAACDWLKYYIVSAHITDEREHFSVGPIAQGYIAALLAEFERLDAKEQKQIKAGKRYGKLGAEHGKKGGRPRKDAK